MMTIFSKFSKKKAFKEFVMTNILLFIGLSVIDVIALLYSAYMVSDLLNLKRVYRFLDKIFKWLF